MWFKKSIFIFTVLTLFSCGKDHSKGKIINLSNEQIFIFPKSVLNNPEIEELYIGSANATAYPPMSLLPKKRIFLSSIPEGISKLKTLRVLSIVSSNIKHLPESLSELNNLTHLNLSFNPKLDIEKYTSTINSLNNLESLVVYNCFLNKKTIERLKAKNPNLSIIDNSTFFRKIQ